MNRDVLHQQEKSIFVGLVLALITSVPTLALALLSGSLLLLNDVPDNLRFIFTNFLGWRILRSVRKGRLQGFDYGTDKLETLVGLVCSIAYSMTMLLLGAFAIRRLIITEPLDDTFTVIGAVSQLFIFLVQGWFWYRNKMLAKKQYSLIMEALWRSNRADSLGSLFFFIVLMLSFLFKELSWGVYIDPAVTLVVVSYSIASFIPVLVSGVSDMLDKTLQEELQLKIDRVLAVHFDDYDGFHGVRSRRAGGRVFIEVALSFNPEHHVGDISQTIASMSELIENDIPGSEARVVFIPCKEEVPKHSSVFAKKD